MKKVPGQCPRCGAPPAVRIAIRGTAVRVVLNVRCEPCFRRGVPEPYYDVVVETEEAA